MHPFQSRLGIVRAGYGTPYYQVIRAHRHRVGGGHNPPLIIRRVPHQANTRGDQAEVITPRLALLAGFQG